MSDLIQRAVEILRAGGVVAFPTETVYGLGADATNAHAIERIFQIKGRPNTNPLIVHVADEHIAQRYASEWSVAATKLVARFWPGPLTIVLKKSPQIVDQVTANLDTVGLRAPDHPLALELLRAFDGPLAGPSANLSNHLSPTTAQHVRDELGDKVDLILDGGPCAVGIESTVLSLVEDVPKILRPGAVSSAMIEAVLHERVLQNNMVAEPTTPVRSPGQFEKHYAPRTPAFWFEAHQRDQLDATDAAILDLNLDPQVYARNFYARLRMLDQQNLRAIYIEIPPVEMPPHEIKGASTLWAAVRDRILRAAVPLK